LADLLLALLLLTRLLLATLLLLTRLLLAALLLLTGLLLAALLATLLLLARLLVWILIHRSFLSNIGSPRRSLVFHGRSQSAGNVFVPRFTLKYVSGTCPNLSSSPSNKENRRWDAICFFGWLEYRFRFSR
jgi:hypothetical protein